MEFPHFDLCLSDLDGFINRLVREYQSGNMNSWEDLEARVERHFTPETMDQMESLVPGWKTMAAYSGGITLVHVMCVFLGSLMLPEFQSLTPRQEQLAKWIILFHDIAKIHIRGKKDTMHAFRSGVQTAKLLPRFGFLETPRYPNLIDTWSEFTDQAFIHGEGDAAPTPDNQKLPVILAGIEDLFGLGTPAALITKTALLHISLDVDPFYPTPAPLTEEEIRQYIDPDLLPLLKVMMLADNEGWSLFDPEIRARQRNDTLKAFEKVERLIA